MPSIVVIDDEALLVRQIGRALASAGHEVRLAQTGAEGLAEARREVPDLVLLDLRLPDTTGLELLEALQELESSLPVVLMTAYGSVHDAVEAMRRGAVDYLQKPLDLEELRLLVDRVLARQRRDRELRYHRARDRTITPGVVGRHPTLLQIFDQVDRLREADLPAGRRPVILLTGETGTGKGLLARAIHERLGGGPFVEINCTALPDSLIEAELFGHERGTFTDAKTARTGLFEAAAGGTVFLDEIGHASLELQAKLLKVIEDKRVRRLGSTRERVVDVQIIAATNRELSEAVSKREFREDLLHRLRVLSFAVPSLRERGADDLELLATHFCEEIGQTYGRPGTLSPEAIAELARYPWPGNVRELRNVIERAILLSSDEELRLETLRSLIAPDAGSQADAFALPEGGISLAGLERDLIRQALARASGNRTRAAALLGLTRDTLRYRLEKFGLS